MNYQNGQVTGAKWFFFLAMVILLGAVALGANIKDARWWNREIASAIAHDMNAATDVERQKAELDLQVLRTQTEIQIAEMKRQAEFEAARQQQELNAATAAAMQKANFQASMYNTLIFGLVAVIAAFSIVLTVLGIYVSIGLYKILSAKAQAIQPSQPQTIVVHRQRRQPSLAAQEARQREREERECERKLIDNRINQIFPESELIWHAAGGKSENLNPDDYPLAV